MTKKKKYNYKDLDLIIERSKLKDQIFQPSSFWSKASKKIKNELEQYGIHNFGNLYQIMAFQQIHLIKKFPMKYLVY